MSPTGSARTHSIATYWALNSFAGRRAGPIVSAPRSSTCHGPGFHPAEVARLPVAPGNSDLCFQWDGPIAGAIVHLERYGVPIDTGPVERFGAKGAGISVYFRDPDGSLLEFISYHRKAGDHA